MDSSSLPSPASLKSLACEVRDPNGNNLIHQFALYISKPSDSSTEIRAALRSFPGSWANKRNADGFAALHLAVLKRNSFMVKMLLSCLPNVDVDAKCSHRKGCGGTALHLFVADYDFPYAYLNTPSDLNDSSEIGKTLLDYGASVDAINDISETPLLIAIKSGQIDIVKLLISKGANLSANLNDYDRTALHQALECLIRDNFVIDFCLTNESDAFSTLHLPDYLAASSDVDGTARISLLEATRDKHLEILKILVESGAPVVKVCDEFGITALHLAANYDRIDVVELLISKGADLNAKDFRGRTPLHGAAEKGSLKAVQVLVESGAPVNECDNSGYTALYYAAGFNRFDVLELLISKGADLNAKSIGGRTALHTSVEKGHLEAVKVLVAGGASVNEFDYGGATPLHFAPKCINRIDVLELLISRGASLNAKDCMGWTPLHLAAINRRSEAVKVLVESGADVNAVDRNGYTASEIAEKLKDMVVEHIEIDADIYIEATDMNAFDWEKTVPPLKKMRLN